MGGIDAIEIRVRGYVNVPHRTCRVVCAGELIGHFWSDGALEIFDEAQTMSPDQIEALIESAHAIQPRRQDESAHPVPVTREPVRDAAQRAPAESLVEPAEE